MSADACCSPPLASGVVACPTCGGPGKSVELLTVKSLVDPVALRRLEPGSYRLCVGRDCGTVYFDTASGTRFTRDEMRVAVWEKEPAGSRTICYCFGENEADMQREIEQSGSSRAAERVRAHIAAGRCACETRNPRGVCCLRDLIEAARGLQIAATTGSTG